MAFLAVPMLFGLVLASAPLIIHLLNRRRFQVIEWAPMRYLKLTIRNNRRRMRIEQMLLLIVRTLLIVLLILTIARPVLSRTHGGSLLSRRSRVSRIVVLDNSLAMGYRDSGTTALEQGKQAVAEILEVTGAQDSITLLTTAPASLPLVRDASLDDSSALLAHVRALQPTDAAANWESTFKVIDQSLASATFPEKELILITDLRRSGWSSAVTELAERWARQGITARVIDVGSPKTANVALLKFVQEDPICLPGAAVKLTASVRNDTAAPVTAAQAVLTVDGEARPVILPPLSPGASVDVPLSVTFDKPGQHSLQLALPDDALPGDNLRYLSLTVRQRLDLTLVDGKMGGGPFESSGDFLQLALSVGGETWHVTHQADTDLQSAHPQLVDAVVLTDVANLSPAAIAEYQRLVKDGMGLMIFCGEQVDPEAYNQKLYQNGAGLLPARLDRIEDGPVKGLVVESFADSPLSALGKLAPAALASIEAKRLMGVAVAKNDPNVRVLARWNDAQGHPAVIERRIGKGRVLLWTMSADREWSDWPVDPTYVLATRSAALAVARPDRLDDNLVAGHPLLYRPSDSQPRLDPRIITPTDSTPQPVTIDGTAYSFSHTEHAGAYTLSWKDQRGAAESHELAVSFDKNASDLDRLSDTQFDELLGSLPHTRLAYQPGLLSSGGAGHEIWRTLGLTLFGMLVVESLLAFYVGRER